MTVARRSEGEVEPSETPQANLAIARDENLADLDSIIEQIDVSNCFVVDKAEGQGVGICGTAQDLGVTVWPNMSAEK